MATPFTIWVKNDASGNPKLYLSDPDAPVPPPPVPVPPTPPPPPPVPTPGVRLQHRGSNIAGGGTSYKTWGASGPVKGTHYLFMTPAELDVLLNAGMRAFRVLFAWEAIQPTEYATIATLTGNFKTYRDELYAVVSYLRSKGAKVLLDIHGDVDAGFATYRGFKVGSTTSSGQKVEDLLANLWGQLAGTFKSDTGIMYGVTNEPHDIAPAAWFACGQKVINAIRATGSVSKIVMPGVDWTGASSWMAHNAAAWNLTDPVSGGLAVQVHLYLDADGGGGGTDIVSSNIAVQRLTDVVAWARAKTLEVWIAEIGFSASNPIAAQTWATTLAYYRANMDVFGGFLWWAAGPSSSDWWGNYEFGLVGPGVKPTAQLNLLTAAGSFSAP